MMLCFVDSMSESGSEDALVEPVELEDESENQPDFFLLPELDDHVEASDAVDPLADASLSRCWSRIWSSPIAK